MGRGSAMGCGAWFQGHGWATGGVLVLVAGCSASEPSAPDAFPAPSTPYASLPPYAPTDAPAQNPLPPGVSTTGVRPPAPAAEPPTKPAPSDGGDAASPTGPATDAGGSDSSAPPKDATAPPPPPPVDGGIVKDSGAASDGSSDEPG